VWLVRAVGLIPYTRRKMAAAGVVVPPLRDVLARMRREHQAGWEG
jgi:hypothetical protein